MRSEGFPFIIWGSGGWTRVRVVCAGSSRARHGQLAVSSGVGACCVRAWWTCVSRGRRGTPDACPRSGRHWRVDPRGRCGETCIWKLVRVRFTWQVSGKVATGGCRERGFAWPASGMVGPVASLGIVLPGRRRESCAAAETARFRGPVREIGCAGACSRVRRCEIVTGAGNPWTCGCKLGADVSWNAVAGCVDCRRACRVCWGLLTRASSGWRRVIVIAGQRRRLGGAVSLTLLARALSGWLRVIGIAVPVRVAAG